jgi:predicted site-specific integrase-resolvase
MPRPILLPLAETAAELGIPPKTLRGHVQSGRAPCHRNGSGKIFFTRADVSAFLETLRVPAGGKHAA